MINQLLDKIQEYIDNMYSQYDSEFEEFHIDKYELKDYIESLKIQ